MTNFTTKWPAVVFWPGPAKSSQNWKKAEGPDFRCFSNANDLWYQILHSRPDNLKRIAFLNFFPVQKLIFDHFWNKKNGIWSKHFSWNWFIWFHEIFCLDFFKFSDLLCIEEWNDNEGEKKYENQVFGSKFLCRT